MVTAVSFGDAAKSLQSVDDSLLLGRRRLDGAIDGEVETSQALALMKHLGDGIAERDPLGLVFELDVLNPAPPRVRPRTAVVGMAESVPKQVLHETMFGAALVALGRRSRADKVAQCFVCSIGNPDARQRAALVTLRELLGVAAVRLDLLAGLPGNQ